MIFLSVLLTSVICIYTIVAFVMYKCQLHFACTLYTSVFRDVECTEYKPLLKKMGLRGMCVKKITLRLSDALILECIMFVPLTKKKKKKKKNIGNCILIKWASMWETVPSNMCTQRRSKPACVYVCLFVKVLRPSLPQCGHVEHGQFT